MRYLYGCSIWQLLCTGRDEVVFDLESVAIVCDNEAGNPAANGIGRYIYVFKVGMKLDMCWWSWFIKRGGSVE